jgi:hypothetical protein
MSFEQGMGDIWSDALNAVLDPDYVDAGSDGPTWTAPVFRGPGIDWRGVDASVGVGAPVGLIEPPPGGYPRIIVHPERPNAAFALISDGWYRSPTGEVVSYKTVADYVLTAKGVDPASLMKALGQISGGGGGISSSIIVVAALVALGLVVVLRS